MNKLAHKIMCHYSLWSGVVLLLPLLLVPPVLVARDAFYCFLLNFYWCIHAFGRCCVGLCNRRFEKEVEKASDAHDPRAGSFPRATPPRSLRSVASLGLFIRPQFNPFPLLTRRAPQFNPVSPSHPARRSPIGGLARGTGCLH